ncbi:MAG: ABC transporter permease [Deltaproteobacteria bacterium]|nr:ABC transporter permease [Deltaproteobacteria bacterium]
MRGMMWKILLGSLRHRRGRVVVAVCATALGASLIVAAVNLRQGIKGKLAAELRNYGANLLLVPGAGTGPFLKQQDLLILQDRKIKDRLLGYVPFLYGVAKIQGKDIVFGGTVFTAVKEVTPWWQVTGIWPERAEAALVGANVASKLGLRLGSSFSVVYKTSQFTFTVTGILSTGGAEENQVFVQLGSLQRLSGRPGLLSSVLISSRTAPGLEETFAFLQRAWPGADLRTLRQVAQAEEAVLSRLEIFFTLVGALVLLASGLTVFATMTTAALERRAEMALMRALGAGRREVVWIFASEAAGIGVMGGFLGSAFGLLFSEVVSLSVFRSFVSPSLISLPTGLVVALAIALFSSLSVVKRTAAVAPAVVLRGE